jgi:hypothetical protein
MRKISGFVTLALLSLTLFSGVACDAKGSFSSGGFRSSSRSSSSSFHSSSGNLSSSRPFSSPSRSFPSGSYSPKPFSSPNYAQKSQGGSVSSNAGALKPSKPFSSPGYAPNPSRSGGSPAPGYQQAPFYHAPAVVNNHYYHQGGYGGSNFWFWMWALDRPNQTQVVVAPGTSPGVMAVPTSAHYGPPWYVVLGNILLFVALFVALVFTIRHFVKKWE